MVKRRRRVSTGRKPNGLWKNGRRIADPGLNAVTQHRLDVLKAYGLTSAMMGNPLAGLVHIGELTERQQRAGERYAAVRATAMGQLTTLNPGIMNWSNLVAPEVSADAMPLPVNDSNPDERQVAASVDFKAADFVLMQTGTRAHKIVHGVSCKARWPLVAWNSSKGRLRAADADMEYLRLGLTALANHWRLPEQRVDDKQQAA